MNRDLGDSIGQSAEMQQPGTKAENASSTPPVPVRTTWSGPYPEGETPSRNTIGQKAGIERDLPRVKLEIPSGNSSNASYPMAGPQVVGDQLEDSTGASQLDLDPKDEHDNESTISPSDEKAETAGSDENHRSPGLEKKKMKRFRLTHNQTRFLMSEFTRQAHPDAAHRERLSREIPGLTPRQVQVWFQNRRAKLKRLTSNDRERMLKSRALPDDFDTTKVLRAPFEGKSTGHTAVASPHDYGVPNPDFPVLRALRTDCFQHPNDEDYLVSPLSSASTAGTYMSSAGQGRSDGLPQTSMMFSRPAASASMSDLHRTIRNDYSITRSSSLSDASSRPPSFHPGLSFPSRYGSHSNQHGVPYVRPPMDYGVPRHPSSMIPYEQHQPFEGSVSPTDSQGAQMTYDISSLGTQPQNYQTQLAMSAPKDYTGIGMGSQLPPCGQQTSSMPVSAPQEYHRLYSYGSASGSLGRMPYTQANASTLSLPTSFAPSEQGPAAHDSMQQTPHTLESLRTKFDNPSYNYASYIQQ
ncbi:uncharacterized protein N7459_006035 [Penicillium hispanicum]|uniref:uncharacterized protein n=1 Tax=Penicillium hispanicum TaxID=1080232 RepID=UPI0025400380|nr:uncharacterized protein N7459_006035 [Penicillium hispanicum]KAJ5580050.1 hypothetical protein N7459_006035 [Penicillium hispanicum]